MRSCKKNNLILKFVLVFFAGAILFLHSCKKDNGSSQPPHVVNVTTLAGDTIVGLVNATGNAARFNYPYGVATDALGNVYVADGDNHCIRKITPAGVVTTLAGDGTPGFVNATGTAAQFYEPEGVTTDASGNVYVADTYNNRIRKITPAGVVTTLAGSGTPGFVNATGTAAQFDNPSGVATDASGNVYVADLGNNRIRKITAAGEVTTLAGSGAPGFVNATGTAAQFYRPCGVATDASGNVYVADRDNHSIRKITPAGVVTTLAGSGTQGFANEPGTAARFYYPAGVATDALGNVYVSDYYNKLIRKITATGVVTTLAGSGSTGFVNGTDSLAEFNYPFSVATDASGAVYVADTDNHCIRKIK